MEGLSPRSRFARLDRASGLAGLLNYFLYLLQTTATAYCKARRSCAAACIAYCLRLNTLHSTRASRAEAHTTRSERRRRHTARRNTNAAR
jgi:hypothetical protein